jgi:hypothetical protein
LPAPLLCTACRLASAPSIQAKLLRIMLLRSWHKTLKPCEVRSGVLVRGIFRCSSGSWQMKERRTMKPTHILIAIAMIGLVSPSGATAATLCVGKDYAGISVQQRSQLEAELKKKGGLKSGDQLAPCDPQTIGVTRSASKKKADPKQANSCKKECDAVSGAADVVCLIPALAAACIIVKPALKTVCPAACDAQHAQSTPANSSAVAVLQ